MTLVSTHDLAQYMYMHFTITYLIKHIALLRIQLTMQGLAVFTFNI